MVNTIGSFLCELVFMQMIPFASQRIYIYILYKAQPKITQCSLQEVTHQDVNGGGPLLTC